MSQNLISLLPDHVANQIAAGEVVQRPASVVKELVENAIDAGATKITVSIKDAGKTLIQVSDNGSGMNPFDARLAFERHATSKISTADDLFKLQTRGFRGEALASIAAVAQTELKTRQAQDAVGQQLIIEGGKFISQDECQCATGSQFSVKNLFFNIPARRNFLKNDQIEQKHIIDEIERVAIPHNNIHFVLNSNGNEVFNLPPANRLHRIRSLFGSHIEKELVPIEEDTPYIKLSGFVSLPSAAIKSKKEQYLFVNDRFVRNPFLNHAVYEAYKELISHQSHPRYFIFLTLDPRDIDVNIHPTKTEVKFTDDRTAYMLLTSAIRRGLGKANASPSLNFEAEMAYGDLPLSKVPQQPKVSYNPSYNPFNTEATPREQNNKAAWESLFEGFKTQNETEPEPAPTLPVETELPDFPCFQIQNKYIVTVWQNNVLVVDQQRAHERVLYEHYFQTAETRHIPTQQMLFPEQLELSANDFQLIKSLLTEFRVLGFEVEIFGKNSVVINGVPADLSDFNIGHVIEGVLETFRLNNIDARVEKHDNLCRSIARNTCIRYGKKLELEEAQLLLKSLFRCDSPLYTASGKIVMMTVESNEVEKFFKK